MKNAIEIVNLSYGIGDKKLLEHIDLQVEKGSFCGLIGPNGSGKSTLLKNIYGFYQGKRGAVYLNGKDLKAYKAKELARAIAVMSQESIHGFDFPVMEILLMARFAYKNLFESTTIEERKLCREALKSVGLESMEERNFLGLSGGEKQRVLLAACLVQQSPILLLDEPTNHLDIKYQIMALKLVAKLPKTTVFSSIHDLNLAARYCDWIIALKDGRVVAKGRVKDVLTPENIEEIFGIKSKIEEDKEGLYIRYLFN